MTKHGEKLDLVGVAVLLALLSLASLFVWAFTAAEASVKAAIIAGLVAVAGATFTYWKERTRSLAEAHRDKKIEIYSNFFDLQFDMMIKTKENPEFDIISDKEFQAKWLGIAKGVTFYGSPGVVKAFSNIKNLDDNSKADPLFSMRSMGKVLLEMRNDIGLSNDGLTELNIHQVYVNDRIE